MKRILVTSTDLMMVQFLLPHVLYLKSINYDVEVACSNVGGRLAEVRKKLVDTVVWEVPLQRSPFKISNFTGYQELNKIILENSYDVIWTNEPVMGFVTRMAARKARKNGTKVMYMSHGYHFFVGGEKKYTIFFPIEKLASRLCDMIVTINYEDYNLTKNKFYVQSVKHINGIGVNIQAYQENKCAVKMRRDLQIKEDSFVILSVGELKAHKNHERIIEALPQINRDNVIYLICGKGELLEYLKKKAENLGVADGVKFLGYRRDIPQILCCADVFAFPSKREGLGLAALEAMAAGLPVVGAKVRGIVDYVKDGETGFLCDVDDSTQYANALQKLYDDRTMGQAIGQSNRDYVKKYDLNIIKQEIAKLIGELVG